MKDRIQLDLYPIPKEEGHLFINVPWFADDFIDVGCSAST